MHRAATWAHGAAAWVHGAAAWVHRAWCMGLQPLELEQAALLFAHFDADSDAACRKRRPGGATAPLIGCPGGGLCRHLAGLRTRGEPTSRSRPNGGPAV